MDFLRLTRSRSGSSSNRKRSPLPSPSGRRASDQDGLSPSPSSYSPSHASDHEQRGRASASTSLGNTSKKTAIMPSIEQQLPLITTESSTSKDRNGNLQVIEFSFPSLLSPPNPAFVSGSDARGILINAQRPAITSDTDQMVQTRSGSGAPGPNASSNSRHSVAQAGGLMLATSSSSSSIPKRSSFSGPATWTAGSSLRPPHLRASVSSDSMLGGTSSNNNLGTGKPLPSTTSDAQNNSESSSSSKLSASESRGRNRIRFAPLPDPRRPRSHSTGRDIWFDDDSENHIHINTRDGTQPSPSSWSSNTLNGSSAQSNSLSMSLGDDLTETAYGSSPGKQANHRRTSSTLSKLLNPLKIGRSRSRESDKLNSPDSDQSGNANRLSLSTSPSASLANWLNGGEPLARSISTGAGSAEIERQRREEFKSTGIPLKKSSTQESNHHNTKQPTRRILYPSVAQGGISRRDREHLEQAKKKIEEPEFVEWTNPSAKMTVSNGNDNDEEDDGSGMAWLKKRRAERERKAKEDAEAAATAPTTTTTASETALDVKKEEPAGVAHTKTSSENTVQRRQAPADQSVTVQSQSENAGESSEPKTGLLQAQEATMEDGELEAYADAQAVQQEKKEDEEEEQEFEDISSQSGDDPDEDDDDDEEEQDDEPADDLSAAEIEEEERLAEEARRTTGGASRELYHSHEHQSSTYTFEARPSHGRLHSGSVAQASSSLNLPPLFERKSSYSSAHTNNAHTPTSSSVKSGHIPRSIASSHPGDWPLREHVVPPC